MPQQFGTVVKKLAEKLGLDLNDKGLIDLMSIQAQVPDEIYNKMTAGIDALMDENGAKNNNELHKHFKALSLAPVDKKLMERLEALGLDDDFKTKFSASKNSFEKMEMLFDKAIEVTEGKVKAQFTGKKMTDDEKQKFVDEIAKLNGEVTKIKSSKDDEIKQIRSQHENEYLDMAVTSMLESKEYANATLPKNVNALTAKTLLMQELKAKGAIAVRNADGTIKLIRSDNPDLDYTENNKPVQFGAFADALLAKNNMLKVSAPAPQKRQGNTPNNIIIPEGQQNEAVVQANTSNLEALEKSLG